MSWTLGNYIQEGKPQWPTAMVFKGLKSFRFHEDLHPWKPSEERRAVHTAGSCRIANRVTALETEASTVGGYMAASTFDFFKTWTIFNLLQYHCCFLSWSFGCGQRCLAGYSPWGVEESDTAEWQSTAQHVWDLSPQPAVECAPPAECRRRNLWASSEVSHFVCLTRGFPDLFRWCELTSSSQ